MISESTAQLVEDSVVLAEPEWVHIKGADEPVRARRLVAISPRDGLVGRAEARLVGRRGEMAALDAMVDRTIGGRGGVVNVVGPPGIGRVPDGPGDGGGWRPVAASRWCGPSANPMPVTFPSVWWRGCCARAAGVADLDGEAARARVREQDARCRPAGSAAA